MLISKTTLASRLKGTFLATVLILASLVVLAYGIDYLVFRYRVASNRKPFGSVTVQSYYAVGQKNGKTEYLSIRHSLKRAFTRCFHTRVMPRVGI